MIKLFTDHPRSKGQGYFEHMLYALGIAAKLLFCFIVIVVHSILPFLFTNTASHVLTRLVNSFDANK